MLLIVVSGYVVHRTDAFRMLWLVSFTRRSPFPYSLSSFPNTPTSVFPALPVHQLYPSTSNIGLEIQTDGKIDYFIQSSLLLHTSLP